VLNKVDDGIDKNSELALSIYSAGLESFGISSPSTSDAEGPEWRGMATQNDLEKARSTLRQFYRDWSLEGSAERESCNGPVIKALLEERSSRAGSGPVMRVLVPGAGLGRLVFDLCCEGFDTEGNEISYHQLLASSYILNMCPQAQAHTLFPWVHSFSNHRNRANHLQSVLVPDIHPATTLHAAKAPGDMSMSASDFLCLYSSADHKDTFDAVASVFFLDTAPNIIRYIKAIHNCLRTGGLLVNVGPLLWHFENNAPGAHSLDGDSSQARDKGGFLEASKLENLVNSISYRYRRPRKCRAHR
jgi:carnosine N-methyltransferase